MQHYLATYWNGSEWADLHSDPLPFEAAEDKATSALLNGRGTTRLRPANQADTLTDLSAEQIAELHAYAARYGKDWKEYLGIEWQCATAPAPLHRLRNTHGLAGLRVSPFRRMAYVETVFPVIGPNPIPCGEEALAVPPGAAFLWPDAEPAPQS